MATAAAKQVSYKARTFDGTGMSAGLASDLDVYLNVFGHDIFVHDFNNDHHSFIAWAANKCADLKINPYTYERPSASGVVDYRSKGTTTAPEHKLAAVIARPVGRSSAYVPEDADAIPGLAAAMGRPIGRSSASPAEDVDVLPGLIAASGRTLGRSSTYPPEDVDVLPGLAPVAGRVISRPSAYAKEDVDVFSGLVAVAGRAIGRSSVYPPEDADAPFGISPVAGRVVGRSSVYPAEDADDFFGLSPVSGRVIGRSSARSREDVDFVGGLKPVVGRMVGRTSAYDIEDPDEYTPFKVVVGSPAERAGKAIFSKIFNPANYKGARWPASSGVTQAYCASAFAWEHALNPLSADDLVNFHMATVKYDSRDIPLTDLIKVQVDSSGAKYLDTRAPALAGRARLIMALFNKLWSLPNGSVDIDPAAKAVLTDLRSFLSAESLDGLGGFGFDPNGNQGFFINFEHLDHRFRSSVLQTAADLNAVKTLLPVADYRVNTTTASGMNTEFPRIAQKWEGVNHETMTVSGLVSTLLEKFERTPEFDPMVEYLEKSLHWVSPIYSITKEHEYDDFRVVDPDQVKRVFDSFVPGPAPHEHAPTYMYPVFAPKDDLLGADLHKSNLSSHQRRVLIDTNAFHDSFVTGDVNTMLDIILKKLK